MCVYIIMIIVLYLEIMYNDVFVYWGIVGVNIVYGLWCVM